MQLKVNEQFVQEECKKTVLLCYLILHQIAQIPDLDF